VQKHHFWNLGHFSEEAVYSGETQEKVYKFGKSSVNPDFRKSQINFKLNKLHNFQEYESFKQTHESLYEWKCLIHRKSFQKSQENVDNTENFRSEIPAFFKKKFPITSRGFQKIPKNS